MRLKYHDLHNRCRNRRLWAKAAIYVRNFPKKKKKIKRRGADSCFIGVNGGKDNKEEVLNCGKRF